jgi:hypothetical protein
VVFARPTVTLTAPFISPGGAKTRLLAKDGPRATAKEVSSLATNLSEIRVRRSVPLYLTPASIARASLATRLQQAHRLEIVDASQKHERKDMNNQFDELTKSLAQSVTRRAAVKKFGLGLAGMVLACFGLATNTQADKTKTGPGPVPCATDADCGSGNVCCSGFCFAAIPDWCDPTVSCCCYCAGKGKTRYPTTAITPCYQSYGPCYSTCSSAGALLGCPGTWV